jgi:hypothetical protein
MKVIYLTVLTISASLALDMSTLDHQRLSRVLASAVGQKGLASVASSDGSNEKSVFQEVVEWADANPNLLLAPRADSAESHLSSAYWTANEDDESKSNSQEPNVQKAGEIHARMDEDIYDLRDTWSPSEEDYSDDISDAQSEASRKPTIYAQTMKKMRNNLNTVKGKMRRSKKPTNGEEKSKKKISQKTKDMLKKPILKLIKKNENILSAKSPIIVKPEFFDILKVPIPSRRSRHTDVPKSTVTTGSI